MILRNFLIACTLLSVVPAFGQSLDPDSLFAQLINDIEIEKQQHYGRVAFDKDTRITFYQLILNSPIEKIEEFMEDTNPVIRTKMFYALTQKNISLERLKTNFDRFSSDSTSYTRGITLVVEWKVNEYMHFLYKQYLENNIPTRNLEADIERLKKDVGIVIKGVKHGEINKDQLLSMDSLYHAHSGIKIISFEFYHNDKGFNTSGNMITKRMKRVIRRSKSGDTVSFENIHAIVSDNTTRKLGGERLKIK